MTSIHDILRWQAGNGWLVLSGGADAGGEIRSQALRRAKADGALAYLGFNEASADDALDDMQDLGAPTGYLVNVVAEDDDTIRAQLTSASLILIDNSVSADEWRSTLIGAGMDGIRAALNLGAVVLAEGEGAAALSAYFVHTQGRIVNGLGLVENTLLLPEITSLSQSESARAMLERDSKGLVIGVGVGSALVLGAEGQIEVWGEREVAIALGRDYQAQFSQQSSGSS
jgi:hypothetical protein